jgi:hypothetical protein
MVAASPSAVLIIYYVRREFEAGVYENNDIFDIDEI